MTDTAIRDLDIKTRSQTTTVSENITINGARIDEIVEIAITDDINRIIN